MEIRSLNDGIPVETINRNLFLYKRDSNYYHYGYEDGRTSYVNGKEHCKISSQKNNCYKWIRYGNGREDRERKARKERERKEKERKARKEKERKARKEKERKAREERERKAREERERKAREKRKKHNTPPPNNNNGGNNDDNNNREIETGSPVSTISNQTPTAVANTFTPTPTYMFLPENSENVSQPVSVAGIAVISTILIGVAVLVVLAVYRKRNSLRQGAVRLQDETDQNNSSAGPRYLSSISNMRSLRIPSMPPRVHLTRLSSATIRLPFRDNTPSPSPLNNNFDNNYLSPHTRVNNNLPPIPRSPSSSGDSPIDYQNSQRTDSVQSTQSHPSSHESYTSLESSFPIPPQRAINDNYNTTPTSATFGDMYNLR